MIYLRVRKRLEMLEVWQAPTLQPGLPQSAAHQQNWFVDVVAEHEAWQPVSVHMLLQRKPYRWEKNIFLERQSSHSLNTFDTVRFQDIFVKWIVGLSLHKVEIPALPWSLSLHGIPHSRRSVFSLRFISLSLQHVQYQHAFVLVIYNNYTVFLTLYLSLVNGWDSHWFQGSDCWYS